MINQNDQQIRLLQFKAIDENKRSFKDMVQYTSKFKLSKSMKINFSPKCVKNFLEILLKIVYSELHDLDYFEEDNTEKTKTIEVRKKEIKKILD